MNIIGMTFTKPTLRRTRSRMKRRATITMTPLSKAHKYKKIRKMFLTTYTPHKEGKHEQKTT